MPQLIYIDNHLLVVIKPAGMLTQKDQTGSFSLEEWAAEWVKKTYQKGGNVFLHAVHRLDKSASGIVLFARSSKALSRLNQSMREKQFKKTYHAFVEGRPSMERGTLEHYLFHGDHKAIVVPPSDQRGKLARLHYQLLSFENGKSLLKIELETGRYHQIRAQLAAMGCPIVGDKRYGSKELFGEGKIALHHSILTFSHPVTKLPLCFEAKPNFISSSAI
jgi:23S rRNA pseudouridine1911/1915/1917 synthase